VSYTTEVVVMGAHRPAIAKLNHWLMENDTRKAQLLPIDMNGAGGTQHFVVDVWAAAFNYMPPELRNMLRDPDTWGHSALSVSVIITGEDEQDTFLFAEAGREASEDEGGVVTRQWQRELEVAEA